MNKNEVFRECFCFSKQDLLKSFKAFMSIEENILTPNTKELYEKFYAKLKETVIPTMSDSMWYYDFAVYNDSIDLEMAHCDEIELDKEGELSGSKASQIKTIFSIPCEYLTAEQFARMHKVSKATVNKWLNHGELSSAKKDGESWLIPEIAPIPESIFATVFYSINECCSDITLDKFPFLENAECIKLYKDNQTDSSYMCNVNYKENNDSNKFSFNKKDIQALNYQLISDNNVQYAESACVFRDSFR